MTFSLPRRAAAAEVFVAMLLAAPLGLLVAWRPLYAVALVALGAAVLALSLLRVSLVAAAIGGVVIGHLVSGQLYVIGALPESAPVVLDLITAALFVGVALRPHPRAPRSHLATVAFLALGLLAVLNPLVPSFNYGLFGVRSLVLPLVAVLIVKEAELSKRDVGFVLSMLVLGWCVNIGFALRQWIVDFTGAEITWIEDLDATYLVGDQIRLMGAMQSNQDFGLLACVAVPTVTAYFFAAERRTQRTLLGVLLLLSFAVLFGSLIRSTLVGGVVGALVAAVIVATAAAGRARLVAYGITVVAILLTLFLVAPGTLLPENKAETLATRVASIFDPASDPSFQQRGSEAWPRMLRIIGANPLGGGPGSAGPLSQAREGDAPFGSVVPDNGYLLMAVQLGIIGAVAFVLMLLAWLRDAVARARQGLPAAAAAAGAVVGAMVAMLAGSYWSLVDPAVTFGVIVGLGLRGDGRRGSVADLGDDETPTPAPAVAPALTAIAEPPRPAPRPAARDRRVLVVASPMISLGGVYSYLQHVLPEMRERGWHTALLWSARVPAEAPPADWTRQVVERSSSLRGRQRHLQEAVQAAIVECRPDVVVSMLPQSDVGCASVRRNTGVPWVAMLHGSPWPKQGEMSLARRLAWRGAVGVAYRQADALVSVSHALASEVTSGLSIASPITVVGSGVDLPEELHESRRREPVIGFLGRLSREKAPDIFLSIARLVPARAKVFGDGPLADAVGAAAAGLPQTEYLGWADRDEALAEIDVLVVPSRREALGLVVLEAGARSVCVVARDTGGIGEVLRLDPELARHCLLPATATPHDFAAALRLLLESREQREQLGQRLHRVVADHFTLDQHVDRLLAALEGAVAERR